MTASIIQSQIGLGSFTTPALTLSSAPTAGNMIVMSIASFAGTSLNTSGWTQLQHEVIGPTENGFLAYRYVSPGDSATLPNLMTGSGGFWRAIAYEVDGMNGDPLLDIAGSDSDQFIPGLPGPYTITAGPVIASGNGQMALGFFFDLNGTTPNPTASSGWTVDYSAPKGADFWAYLGAHNPSDLSDSVSLTVTYQQGGGNPQVYAFMVVVGEGSTPSIAPIELPLIALEALLGGYPSANVSLIAADVLTGGNPQVDLSLITADALTGGNPYVYNPLIALEAVYGLYTEVELATEVFPTLRGLGWSVHKKPMFRTKISEHVSGREVRASFMQYPLWDFELTFEFLKDSVDEQDLNDIMGFYLKQLGRFNAWLYKDPNDYHAVAQQFGVGDGVTLEYLAMRGLGGFYEPVGQFNFDVLATFLASSVDIMTETVDINTDALPTGYGPIKLTTSGTLPTGLLSTKNYWIINAGNGLVKFALSKALALAGTAVNLTAIGSGTNTIANSVAVYDNGTLVDPSDYTLVAPNRILFDVAPTVAHVLTADFDYYFQCRFSEDQQDYENFMFQLWTLQECTFRSIIDE